MTALEKFNEIKGFYKRIKDIYGVSVEEFLKISKEDGSNG